MPGTHPPNILVGGRQRKYPPILLRTFGYSRPILVALRSLSLKLISFGYKTPPIRFSQAGRQSAHKARPPNLELALTPLLVSVCLSEPLSVFLTLMRLRLITSASTRPACVSALLFHAADLYIFSISILKVALNNGFTGLPQARAFSSKS